MQFSFLFLRGTIDKTNSEILLLYLMLFSSVLGSIIDLLRRDEEGLHNKTSLGRTFANGIGAGIVCFLSIKSGSIDYYTDTVNLSSTQTPYFNAFIGFLGGMFATDVFDALGRIAHDFFSKIKPLKKNTEADEPKNGNTDKDTEKEENMPPAAPESNANTGN